MLSRHVETRTLLRPMHLLFIRHAESVDNVAGLYGGSRDAALTAHGVLQTKRLASALVESELDIRHVFSSPIQRAAKTAKAICDARNDGHGAAGDVLRAVPVSELREKHFGNWEGVKYAPAPAPASTVPRRAQIDAETPESMRSRANFFLDHHLWPVAETLTLPADSDNACVIVVSHGILLGALTRALAEKLAHGSSLNASFAQLSSARIAWSNTGYLDIAMARQPADSVPSASRRAAPWSWTRSSLVQVNCTKHLAGLHKTRGGIGSAAHDHRQRTLEGFFGAASGKRKAHDATD